MPGFKIHIIEIINSNLGDFNNIKDNKTTTCYLDKEESNSISQNSLDYLNKSNSNILLSQNLSNSNTLLFQNLSNSNTLLSQNYDFNSYSSYYSNENDSTIDNTKQIISMHNTIIINNYDEKKFNSVRASYYLKYNLHDIPLFQFNNFNLPAKYNIKDNLFGFLYPNEIVTYMITISGFFKTDKINILPNIPKIENIQFNYFLGLAFCGKNIEIETNNGVERKKCTPHEFLCRNCNEINKKIYNIKKKYIIGINGRIAKINKGKYHCFGHFLIKNQIEDCITNFCCKSCEQINLYSKYYQENDIKMAETTNISSKSIMK